MGNFKETYEEIKNYVFARVPLIILDTAERERAEKILKKIEADLGADILYYTDARQVRSLNKSSVSVDVKKDPLPYAANEFMHKRNSVFALGDCRRVGEDCSYSRELLNLVYLAKESNCTLILITPDPVWPRLAQFGMLVELNRPDLDERYEQILNFKKQYSGRFTIEWDESEITRAATLLRGFSETQIDNILCSSLVEHGGLYSEDISQLSSQKSRLYAAVPSIQCVNIPESLTVSGLENLKAWLDQKQKIFFASDEVLKSREINPPRGILLVGVPGCGKSLSAKMVAKQWGLSLFRFDLGTIYDKWVGESEKKMKDALQFLDNVSPCIVWVDEIEKALSVSDSGNDVGRRVLGQFLFWLQESSSRVFLVATANDISALPTELFRKGRFSELFFVDLPNDNERADMLVSLCKKSLKYMPNVQEIKELVQMSKDFTYADIEYAVKTLAEDMILQPDIQMNIELLKERFEQIIPYSRTNPEALQQLHEWGKTRAVNASK